MRAWEGGGEEERARWVADTRHDPPAGLNMFRAKRLTVRVTTVVLGGTGTYASYGGRGTVVCRTEYGTHATPAIMAAGDLPGTVRLLHSMLRCLDARSLAFLTAVTMVLDVIAQLSL